jgi:hypothetical protein
VARGFAESFSTTLWGSGLLIVSGLAWFILRALSRLFDQRTRTNLAAKA